MKRWFYFVHRFEDPAQADFRCPIGGVSVTAWTEITSLREAWIKARHRFRCKPREMLMITRVVDRDDVRHVQMMEQDWERAFADFTALMTVS